MTVWTGFFLKHESKLLLCFTGSAPRSEKKVARMNKVIKDMMQQRKQQAAEKEARKLANVRSPRTPGSPARARIGSPAGSPRTPPASSLNRQSPVRAAGPGDPIVTTPLRAPVDTSRHLQTHSQDNTAVPMSIKSDSINSKSPIQPHSNNSQEGINTQASVFSQSQPKEEVGVPGASVQNSSNVSGSSAVNTPATSVKVESMDTNT